MSKYTTSTTNFTDRDCLVASLKEAGYTAVQVYDKAKNLTGYRGDTRSQTAEIIIPRNTKGGMEAYSNDVGFKFNAATGRYEAIISEYDSGIFTPKVMSEVKAGYTEAITKQTYARRGLRWVGTTIVNGNRNLEFAVIMFLLALFLPLLGQAKEKQYEPATFVGSVVRQTGSSCFTYGPNTDCGPDLRAYYTFQFEGREVTVTRVVGFHFSPSNLYDARPGEILSVRYDGKHFFVKNSHGNGESEFRPIVEGGSLRESR